MQVLWLNRSLDDYGVVEDEVSPAEWNRKWPNDVPELLYRLQHDQVEDSCVIQAGDCDWQKLKPNHRGQGFDTTRWLFSDTMR